MDKPAPFKPVDADGPPVTPCWHCRHMLTVDARTLIITCGQSVEIICKSSDTRVGCPAWEREPGTDDEPYPADTPTTELPLPAPAKVSRSRDGWWTEPPRAPMPSKVPSPAAPPPPAHVSLAIDGRRGIFEDDGDDGGTLMQGSLLVEGYLPRLGRREVRPRAQGQR